MERYLNGKNIVITGGGKGIGYAIAKKCIEEGANVVISGRNEDVLKNACNTLGEKCNYVKYDISNVEQSTEFLKECMEKCGKIDCLVNNAGISLHEGNFKNVTLDGFDKQFNVNMKGTYFLSKAFIEMKLKEEKPEDSEILIISSETGDQCYDIPYGMTKAALNSLTGALSRRLYKSGIRVNAIAPGVTLSDMTKDYAMSEKDNYSSNSSSGRVFIPEEIAETAIFLLSDASKCISGEVIHCNAGNHLSVFWKED